MNLNSTERGRTQNGPFLMALHSSSNTLGIAIINSRKPKTTLKSASFPLGRELSKNLISCVEEILPSSYWPQLGRLSVAIGPGGFTGTRLTVVMARTIAQQLNISLDGISSFALMAPRLATTLKNKEQDKPFWIIKDLPRRGLIAGNYIIRSPSEPNDFSEVKELEKPRLFSYNFNPNPHIIASDKAEEDVIQLLRISLREHNLGRKSHWKNALPIYPTSPVENNNQKTLK